MMHVGSSRSFQLGQCALFTLALLTLRCSSDTEAGTENPPITPGTPGTPTGAGDGNFRKAFKDGGVGVTCELTYSQMVQSGAPSLTVGNTTLFVGFQQYGNNQDPVLFRFDNQVKVYCEHHEAQSPDGRALGITWDGGPTAYLVYTITGGGTAFDTLAKGGWISSYGNGGASSKVAVIAQVETQFGTVQRATFVPARRQSGTITNSLSPADAVTVLTDGTLEFVGSSAFAPLNPDRSPMCLANTEYPAALDGKQGPSYLARFSADLSSALCASTAGCSLVQKPCK